MIFGPGNRGKLGPVSGPPPTTPLPVVNPENPTPGTVEMTDYLYKAFAADFNDHIRDTRVDVPWADFEVNDIAIPPGTVGDPNTEPAPPMDPFVVFEDDKVKVSATLVDHSPCWPAFAFRFDTDDGSITFSGDTNPSQNLIKMAAGTDLLVHEVIDKNWVESLFPDPTTPEAQAIIKHLLGVHTLIEDVGGVAEQAEAKTLVLTHLRELRRRQRPDGDRRRPAPSPRPPLIRSAERDADSGSGIERPSRPGTLADDLAIARGHASPVHHPAELAARSADPLLRRLELLAF